jgi:molybdenum cofactor biosynthesis enzyme MoaA
MRELTYTRRCLSSLRNQSSIHLASTKRRFSTIEAKASSSSSHPLVDSFGRYHDYLRVSLTEKCNLRCIYCMPAEGVDLTPRPELLTLAERKRVISIFHRLGMKKIRFTGGEPTISNQLLSLVSYTRDLGVKSIGITTNGLELGSNRRRIDELIEHGLTSINISLDTFVKDKFQTISRRDAKQLYNVLSAIYYAASKPELQVKVNCVLMKGFNDDELHDFVSFVKDLRIDCRFIEVMPFDGNEWTRSKLMSYHEAIDIIQSSHERPHKDQIKLAPFSSIHRDPNDTTKWYQAINAGDGAPYQGRIGFITSMTR